MTRGEFKSFHQYMRKHARDEKRVVNGVKAMWVADSLYIEWSTTPYRSNHATVMLLSTKYCTKSFRRFILKRIRKMSAIPLPA